MKKHADLIRSGTLCDSLDFGEGEFKFGSANLNMCPVTGPSVMSTTPVAESDMPISVTSAAPDTLETSKILDLLYLLFKPCFIAINTGDIFLQKTDLEQLYLRCILLNDLIRRRLSVILRPPSIYIAIIYKIQYG